MRDFALVWGSGNADLAVVDDDLAADDGLRTALLLSFFLDRRAEDDDALPGADDDVRGWWADQFLDNEGDRIGSRLWLLERSKRLPEVSRDAEDYAREAVRWLEEDGVTDRTDIAAETTGDMLALAVTAYRPGRDAVTDRLPVLGYRYDDVWQGEAAR